MQERKAEISDLSGIMEVIEDARQYLKEQGIDQWQDGFPTQEVIVEDIVMHESYVFVEDEEIVGYMAVNLDTEASYETIYDGAWKLEGSDYATIHRNAVKSTYRGQGISLRMFFLAEQLCRKNNKQSIRIDTHRDNQLMQHLATKYGYEYCGVIQLANGAGERIVYEKVLFN
ncbi:MAG: GNAT family N-acetyltransferase [Clostridiales bacterium]|nr:GNAT family N-acetyltransferase [Clostridiales bacterium]